MPRPDKPINSSPLYRPVAASRGSRWSKHASPEHAAQYEPDPSVVVDPVTQETVFQIDLAEPEVVEVPDAAPMLVEPVAPPKPEEWTSERVIEGRIYRRTDRLVPSEVVS